MMNKKKVCLVIPTLQVGGMERVMSELAGYFCRKSELEVHLVLYGKNPEIFYQLPENIIIHKPSFLFNDKHRFWFTIKTIHFLRKKIKDINPYTILSFGEYWNSFVLLVLFGLKLSVFVSDRCQPDKSLGKLHDFLRKILYPRAKGVIIQTEKAREIYHRKIPRSKLHVIGNPIRKINVEVPVMKENIILTVGRLITSKHHDELIKVFSKINNLNWKLIIIGDDALKQNNKERLERLIDELGMQKNIILTGSRKDVDTFYLKSKIFAFTSSSEGFPNVIGEAMSAGLPVIAFDCVAGPSDLIENGKTGYLVHLFNYDLFEERLRILMQNEELRIKMGKKGKEKIKMFSVEKIGEQFYKVILN